MDLFTSSHELPNYAVVQNILAKNAAKYFDANVPIFLQAKTLETLARQMQMEVSYHTTQEEALDILKDLLDLFVVYGNTDNTTEVLKLLTLNVYNLYN